jgi:hypothetical protein
VGEPKGEVTVSDDSAHSTLTLHEVARSLSVSVATARRRIKEGQLVARLIPGSPGPGYQITLHRNGTHPTRVRHEDQVHLERVAGKIDGRAVLRLSELVNTLAVRYEQVTRERDERIRLLEQERADLHRRLGLCQGQLDAAKERLALLETPPETLVPADPMHPPARGRSWWSFWRGDRG